MLPTISPLAWAVWLLAATLCAHYSRRKGRNPYLWFIIGFLGSFLGLYILFLLPRAKQKQSEKPVSPPPPSLTTKLGRFSHPYWYYLDEEHITQGPLSLQALQEHLDNKIIKKETLIWNEGLETWKKLEDISYTKSEK